MDGAVEGFLSGSALLLAALFVTAPVFGRLWCSWLCPTGCLGDILAFFVAAGGIHGFDPLRLTESGIAIDAPGRYQIYYGVIAVFFLLALGLGRRAACHSVCWMAQRMVEEERMEKANCILCGNCTSVTPAPFS